MKKKSGVIGNKQKIYDEGEVIDHWPCDMGYDGELESNGSRESLVLYKGEYYFIATTWEDDQVIACNKIDKDEALREDGFIGTLIKRAEREVKK